MVLWVFYVQENPKAQPAVVLILKRLRRWGHSLNTHPTDWENQGIEPATLGLQGISLSPTPWRRVTILLFVAVFLGYNQYSLGGLMAFVVLCPGAPEGSTGSGFDFKASQKKGPKLKVSSDILAEAGNGTCDPWFTRHR